MSGITSLHARASARRKLFSTLSPSAVVFAAALCGLPQSALAQDSVVDTADVIVTAPIEGSAIESLQGATILRRDDIVARLNGGLGNTLDSTPGISTTFFGAGASRPIIRGLGDDRVRVLQNGIGAIDASTASPDHAVTSDGLDAERIEVLRGAAALAYGGNAVGGVVNVIDQSIPTSAIDDVEAAGLAAYSSVNDGFERAASVGLGAGPFALRATGSARDTEDYEIPGRAAVDDLETTGVAPNSWTEHRAYAVGGSILGSWGFVGLAGKRTTDAYGLPGEDGEAGDNAIGPRIELEQTRIEARGDLKLDFGVVNRLDFGVQHSDYEHTEFEQGGEPGTRFTSEGWEGRSEAHHGNGALRGALGIQYSDVDFAADGEEAFITATNTTDLGLFLIERWDRGAWGLEGGARFEQRELDNVDAGERSFDSTSASFGVFVRPAQGWFIGTTLARTGRAPTQIELFANGPHLATNTFELGDDQLGQETATSFEISARYGSQRLQLEANAFRIGFEDYIALTNRGDFFWFDEETETSGFAPSADDAGIPGSASVLPVFAYEQRDATFSGGEVSVKALLFDYDGFAFSGDLAVDLVRAEFDDGGNPPRIPPSTLTLGLSGESPFWTGRVEVIDTSAQYRTSVNETPTEGFTFLNASLAFRPHGPDGAYSFRLDGRNLGDEEGRVHASFLKDVLPLQGRDIRFSVVANF